MGVSPMSTMNGYNSGSGSDHSALNDSISANLRNLETYRGWNHPTIRMELISQTISLHEMSWAVAIKKMMESMSRNPSLAQYLSHSKSKSYSLYPCEKT